MALPASDNTVLRRLKAKSGVEHPDLKIRVLGADEWAWRKRQRYGTILMDLEKKQVIDLLPVRSVASLATWLGSHPEAEMSTKTARPSRCWRSATVRPTSSPPGGRSR
jgi:transposase